MTNIVVQNFKANKFVAFDKHGEIIPVQKVADLLQGLMRENKRIQNCYVSLYKDNVEYIRQIGSHATAAQRQNFLQCAELPKTWKTTCYYNRNNIDESCRILKTYQKRVDIAELILENPELTSKEITQQSTFFISYRLIDNIRRAGTLPEVPTINNPRLSLGVDVNLVKTLCTNGFWLHNVHFQDETLDILIPISRKLFKNLGKIVKIGAPIVRLDGKGYYCFDITVKSRRPTAKLQPNMLSVDPKLNGGFAAALIRANGTVSGMIKPSVQSIRCQKKISRISRDIKLKTKKISRISDPNKINLLKEQIRLDREKKLRLNEALDWQTAVDLVDYAEQTCANICYESVKCNMGGRLHFRSTQKYNKLKQVAAKRGRKVLDVNCAYTSQDCPKCGNRLKKKLSERVHNCKKCGLICDRDYASAVVMTEKCCNDTSKLVFNKEVINKAHRILRKKSLRDTKPHKDSLSKRIILNRGNPAKRISLSFNELYLVGENSYKISPVKQNLIKNTIFDDD